MVTTRCSRKIDKTTWIRHGVRQILSIFLEYQVRILTVFNRVAQKILAGIPRKIDKNCLSFCPGWYSRSTEIIHYIIKISRISLTETFICHHIHDLLNQHLPLTGIIVAHCQVVGCRLGRRNGRVAIGQRSCSNWESPATVCWAHGGGPTGSVHDWLCRFTDYLVDMVEKGLCVRKSTNMSDERKSSYDNSYSFANI